ncbi:hypothetical protein A6395_04610 [Exiguobacterium sp. SH31]|uniref:DUF2812 domain-containing protein n=1 Tax=unclassified Exiguobacterium TaxID=2644629 RepID=UPI0008C85ABB|nr:MULTISPECIES: DUF2812 domain-containing protein [unclassified Exiguobacterium]OGX79888.1 hypothetical protein A6395_04610 [Exiguobacterium sp. SH31]TCI73506.1 DUF2812 domain-containing protein [Exiguobacterium sp. SH0S7]
MKTKTVYRFYADYEKEEVWLNDMAGAGWFLERFRLGRYTFVQGDPNEYTYRIELMEEAPNNPKSIAYFEFLEEMGIEVVATTFRWVFLRKLTADGPFRLYSDIDSKIRHERRIFHLYSFVLYLNLFVAFLNLSNGIESFLWVPNFLVSLLFIIFVLKQYRKLSKLRDERQLVERDQ